MNSDNIIQEAAGKASVDIFKANAMANALATAIRECCANFDSVAIPGFGTFSTVKTDEYVCELNDGSRTLMPPHIAASFSPGSMLRKHLSINE
ncbi:MAG: HU family DNA-binding protein [Muribaculaceae bacterium]|nr:HU family DNA-binding protein [Muribaculaceae bacterium]